MIFDEWFQRSDRLRRDTARDRPGMFFVREVGRYGAPLELILVVADATPWKFHYDSPFKKLYFIVAWSLLMAGWSLWRLQRRKSR
jgi:hypothetical protein